MRHRWYEWAGSGTLSFRTDETTGRRRFFAAGTVAATTVTLGMLASEARPALAMPLPLPPAPATADPAAAPAAGAMPSVDGPLTLPTFPQPAPRPPADLVGPLAAQIFAEFSMAERLGEQVKAIEDELAACREITEELRVTWEQAKARLTAAEAAVEAAELAAQAAAEHAAKTGEADVQQRPDAAAPDSTAVPDSVREYVDHLKKLGRVPPPTEAEPAAEPTATEPATAEPAETKPAEAEPASPASAALQAELEARRVELREARAAEQAARVNLEAARAVEEEISTRLAVAQEQFERHRTAAAILRERNAELLAEATRARDAYEEGLNAARAASAHANGLRASPKALAAVAFALRQLGKPYEWAAEGPNSYDCSGLVMAAYRSVDVVLPRVSRYQYAAGTPVLPSQLLPGDLLFFSTDRSDWRQIHHVAMYLGDGKMIHAPTVGDVVKISPIWWSEFFGATRPVPAVGPGPVTAPARSATPASTPSDSANPLASASPSPSASSSASAPPTQSPSESASPSESPSPSASPSPGLSASPSVSPSPAPSLSTAPSASPTATPSLTPTPSAGPSPTPSPSTAESTSTTVSPSDDPAGGEVAEHIPASAMPEGVAATPTAAARQARSARRRLRWRR